MEVEGNTAASVQDASFLKKDAVVDEKLNNAVEATITTASENVETIKKSEADCSSTVDSSSLEKNSDEKDDLLEQIEEVCNDKVSDLKNCDEICKTSEHEFLKKIEEIEKIDGKVATATDEKANNIAKELKAKNIIECEATAIDAVVVGDKIIEVKEDQTDATDQSKSATSSEDAKESTDIISQKPEGKCESTTDAEQSKKDTTVSSSTTKAEEDVKSADSITCEEKVDESEVQPVQSTATNSDDDVEKTLEAMEATSDDQEDGKIEEKMDVDDDVVEVNNEVMEVDVKESTNEHSVVAVETDNEAKSKEVNKSETAEHNNVDTKETKPTTMEKDEPAAQNCSPETKPSKKDVQGEKSEPSVVVNQSDEKKEDEKPIVETTKPDNKPLLEVKFKENIVSSSLTNTPVSSSNVFNSTPIQKQFEISSENVSKISDVAELSHTEKEEEASSTKPLTKSFEDSTTETGTCATSETDQPSSDGAMKKYIDAIKKYNGMPDTTTDEEDTSTPAKIQKLNNEKFEIKMCHLSASDLKRDSTYEVNICCEKNDVRYLSIERVDIPRNKNTSQVDKALSLESSVQSSSNGSVTSLPAYSLPQKVETSASTSSSTNCHSMTTSPDKHTIVGIEELCNFMIKQFTKIKHTINPESAKTATASEADTITTPSHQIKRNKKNSPSVETPSTSVSKTKSARKRSHHEDDLEGTPKAKHVKRDISKETPKAEETADSEETKAGPCVLAKWVDKKFYAGKITGEKPGNKFVVLFEDGASKTLPKESIVFGEGDTLPLQDQHVYALVDEDYECGTVLSIEKSTDKVEYTVKTENTTVKVTASDIYLEVDQAKEIQKLQNIKTAADGVNVEEEESSGTRPSRNKRPPASPSTPEAGYSGAVGKRGGKRQKRLPSPPTKRLSEDSDSSDCEESVPPLSPKEIAGLESVEGVQPELQNSQNDSELSRMIFTSDYKKIQPNCDVDELLGPLPKANLFRNKHFLLTCTVGLRPHRYHQEKAENMENNRFKQFSAVPYIKYHLKKQLEAGGAKVYNYFEDVPKTKYKQCKLIAPRPCCTAKYVQCLSSDIQAISHEWVIDSCRNNKLCDFSTYLLPAGWSLTTETFVAWKTGKANHTPFSKNFVLIAGEHNDFVELWGRVCKAGGAKLRLIKSLDDITPTTTGYMVAESDCSHAIKAKAQHYGIPVISTVWIVQSLIMGTICPPNSHPRLSQLFEDDEI